MRPPVLIPAELDLFFRKASEVEVTRGTTIIENTNTNPAVYYLTNGIVRQYSLTPDGTEVTINIFKPFAFFPLSWTIGKVENRNTFVAVTECTYHILPATEVFDFLKDKPHILMNLLERLYSGVDGVLRRLEQALSGTARLNVLLNLVILAYRFGQEDRKNKITISVRITQAELGTMAGIARETVSRELGILEKEGLIQIEVNTISIPSLPMLEAALAKQ